MGTGVELEIVRGAAIDSIDVPLTRHTGEPFDLTADVGSIDLVAARTTRDDEPLVLHLSLGSGLAIVGSAVRLTISSAATWAIPSGCYPFAVWFTRASDSGRLVGATGIVRVRDTVNGL